MTTTDQKTKRALWVPGWYELDQPLAVGQNERLWFYQDPPSDVDHVEEFDFVFFNQLSAAANCQVRTATIMSITHPEIGELNQIETDGLDYIFHTADGKSLVVNAEENPGSIYESQTEIDNWSVEVTLMGVSEPIVDFT